MSNSKSYSGIFGHKVFLKGSRGKSILTIPTKGEKKAPSTLQLRARESFRLAANYAKAAMSNPERKAAYAARAHNGMSAYAEALTDFLTPPRVTEIDVHEYSGKAGDVIHIFALDNFGIRKVDVRLFRPDGQEVEAGDCMQDLTTGTFDYIATETVDSIQGIRVIARAMDYPGHLGQMEVTI